MNLGTNDVRELYSVLAAEAMSRGYRQYVADPAVASMEAVNYEKYEDILLRKVVLGSLAQSEDVALIELGSGPGRLLHQYGSAIAQGMDVCEYYRRLSPQLYKPENLPHHERLRLLLGVDFSEDMLQSASRWLARDGLGSFVERGTIAQMRATVRDLPVDFSTPEWSGTTRIACILFQTLGNQLGTNLQVEMLESARRCVGPRGVVFVSVFNAESFSEQGAPYYQSIEGSVGDTWALEERSFLSQRGVFSKWLYPNELENLFAEAGMEDAVVFDEDDLRAFPEYGSYIDTDSQERYKRRALVGVYTAGIDVQLK
jgi:hypothetical protein